MSLYNFPPDCQHDVQRTRYYSDNHYCFIIYLTVEIHTMKGLQHLPYLSKYRHDDESKDRVVNVQGRQFKVHSIILRSVSEYFDMLLRRENSISIDITANIFDKYLDYIYGIDVEFTNGIQQLEFYFFLDYTGTKWNSKHELMNFIPKNDEEYSMYSTLVLQLIDNPEEFLTHNLKYITYDVDLSVLPEKILSKMPKSDPSVINSWIRKIEILESQLTGNILETAGKKDPLRLKVITNNMVRGRMPTNNGTVELDVSNMRFISNCVDISPGDIVEVTKYIITSYDIQLLEFVKINP